MNTKEFKMNKDGFSCLGLSASFVALIVVSVVAEGWALSVIWNWFMPSLFGVTGLSVFQAMGVGLVIRSITGKSSTSSSSSNKSDNKTIGEAFVEGFVIAISAPITTVAFAWMILQMAF